MSDDKRKRLAETLSSLSNEDKAWVINFLVQGLFTLNTPQEESDNDNAYDELNDNQRPYTIQELYARLDESEAEAERGEGKSFEEMMSGFRGQLSWLR